MSKLNLDAALAQLQGQALEHLAAIDLLLNKPAAIADHTDFVKEIKKHAKGLAESEEALAVLKKYFTSDSSAVDGEEDA